MIVLAYLLAANVPGPWSDWMGLIGVIAVVDAAVMLASSRCALGTQLCLTWG